MNGNNGFSNEMFKNVDKEMNDGGYSAVPPWKHILTLTMTIYD